MQTKITLMKNKSVQLIDRHGVKRWLDAQGQLHREDGPALEWLNGEKEWWINGIKITKEEFVRIINNSERKMATNKGVKSWKNQSGQLHREDGPAVELLDGTRLWYLDGQLHRSNGPAVELANGTKFWWIEGKNLTEEEFNNRKKLTCKVDKHGNKYWRNKESQLHRTDGPAVEFADGSKAWWLNGQLHREDGPAIEYADGGKYWYLNDQHLTEEEFNNRKKLTCKVDKHGNKYWRNKESQLHRTDGPAIERADGRKSWWVNGKLHREDGPAIECYSGDKWWYQNGKLHREDGPAWECADGNKEWYRNGKRHREDGPAVEYANGVKYWYLNDQYLTEEKFNSRFNKSTCEVSKSGNKRWLNKKGLLHREDGPAIERTDGTKEWWVNGVRHRKNGPAYTCMSGDGFFNIWYLNGKQHREDGPAIECDSGYKEWWINDKKLTQLEFLQQLNKKKQLEFLQQLNKKKIVI